MESFHACVLRMAMTWVDEATDKRFKSFLSLPSQASSSSTQTPRSSTNQSTTPSTTGSASEGGGGVLAGWMGGGRKVSKVRSYEAWECSVRVEVIVDSHSFNLSPTTPTSPSSTRPHHQPMERTFGEIETNVHNHTTGGMSIGFLDGVGDNTIADGSGVRFSIPAPLSPSRTSSASAGSMSEQRWSGDSQAVRIVSLGDDISLDLFATLSSTRDGYPDTPLTRHTHFNPTASDTNSASQSDTAASTVQRRRRSLSSLAEERLEDARTASVPGTPSTVKGKGLYELLTRGK